MSNIKDRFTNFLSEVEQLESDNKKLNDDILALEKDIIALKEEKENGYKTFNTNTHVLVSIDRLTDIADDIAAASSDASYAQEEAESAYNSADNASSNAHSVTEYCDTAEANVNELIASAKE